MYFRYLLHSLAVILGLVRVSAVPGVCKNMRYYNHTRFPDYCASPKEHLGCGDAHRNWAKQCGEQPKLLDITPDIIKHILRTHNVYRNIVAQGTLPNLPVASRMLKMKWDANLAELAEFAVKRCTIEPIKLNISTFEAIKPGYNAVLTKYDLKEEQDEIKILDSQVKIWYDQHRHTNLKSLKSGKASGGQEISHFMQIITSANDRIGCGIAQFRADGWKQQLMVCMYACYKLKNKSVYRIGKRPGEKCKCGSDTSFKNICEYLETIGDCTKQPDEDDSYKPPPPTPTSKPTKKTRSPDM